MSPEINIDVVFNDFRAVKPSFPIIFTAHQKYGYPPISRGYVPMHRFNDTNLIVCLGKTNNPNWFCPICENNIKPPKNSNYELYYDRHDKAFFLNKVSKDLKFRYDPFINLLVAYGPKYKHPLIPSAFNLFDLYPSHHMPRLQSLYDTVLKYVNEYGIMKIQKLNQ